MAAYGYGKMHAQLVAQGWDPAGVGRDQVMNIMRELGIRGVRRGRTPVTTEPAKGTGGRPDLVDGRFEACAPNRLHVADVTYVRMANGSFGYTAFADGVYARRIVGWACAMTMNTQELPLQALEQTVSWCVCSIESGPCERVDVFHVSGRFWSTSACGEKRTPARPAWTSFPS